MIFGVMVLDPSLNTRIEMEEFEDWWKYSQIRKDLAAGSWATGALTLAFKMLAKEAFEAGYNEGAASG